MAWNEARAWLAPTSHYAFTESPEGIPESVKLLEFQEKSPPEPGVDAASITSFLLARGFLKQADGALKLNDIEIDVFSEGSRLNSMRITLEVVSTKERRVATMVDVRRWESLVKDLGGQFPQLRVFDPITETMADTENFTSILLAQPICEDIRP